MDMEVEMFDGRDKLREYILRDRLGEGPRSITYQAGRKDGDDVALEVIWGDLNYLECGKKALEKLKDCDHTVKFISLTMGLEYTHRNGEKSTVDVMALELCPNGSLFPYIKHRLFSLKRVQGYFGQLCSVLESMKDKNVIHRNIVPQNILLGEKWNLKMAGFGYSVIGKEAKGRAGTKGYMAPEVDNYPATGESYSRKIDIYSSGVVLFNMLYGWNFTNVRYVERYLRNGNKHKFWNRQLRWILQRRENTLLHASRGEELLYQRIAGLKTEEYPIVITYSLNKMDPQVCYDSKDVEMVAKKANRLAELERVREDTIVFEVHKILEMDLLDGMLETDPARRWDFEEIKQHPFYKEGCGFSPTKLEEKLEEKLKRIEKRSRPKERRDSLEIKQRSRFRLEKWREARVEGEEAQLLSGREAKVEVEASTSTRAGPIDNKIIGTKDRAQPDEGTQRENAKELTNKPTTKNEEIYRTDDAEMQCEPRLSGAEVARCLHELPWKAQSKVQLTEISLRFDKLSFEETCGKNLQRFNMQFKRYVRKHIPGVLRIRLLSVRPGSVIAYFQLLRNVSTSISNILEVFDNSDEKKHEGGGSESDGNEDLGVASGIKVVKSQSAINFVNEREQEGKKLRIDEVKSHLAFLSWCALSSKENENLDLDLDSEMFERIDELPCADGKKVETTRWKATKPNLVRALVTNCTILHYSGHGIKNGLLFDEKGKSVVISGQDFLKAIKDAKETETYELKLVFLAACHSQAVGKEVAKLVDHVIVCKESEELGDIKARIFQYHFYQWFFRGATILNSFEHAKESIHKRADSLAESYKNMINNYNIKGENETAALDMINDYVKSMRNEAEKYVLIPADGDHNVKFRFIECKLRGKRRRYSDLKHARPEEFMPYLVEEMKTIEQNFVSDLVTGFERRDSVRKRWVHIVGAEGAGKTFLAKEMGWRLSHDMDAPDAIFFIQLKNLLKKDDDDGNRILTHIDSELKERSQKGLQAYARTGQKILIILDDLDVLGVNAAVKAANELLGYPNNLALMTTSCEPMPIGTHALFRKYKEINLMPENKEYAMRRLFQKALLDLDDEEEDSMLKRNLEFLASKRGVRYIWVRSATANGLLGNLQRSKNKPSNPKNMANWALELHRFCKEGKEGDSIRLIDENKFINKSEHMNYKFKSMRRDMDENGKRVSMEKMQNKSREIMGKWIRQIKEPDASKNHFYLRQGNNVEVPAHLAFAFSMPLDKPGSILNLGKDVEMLQKMSKENVRKDGTKLHVSKWRATKENISKALRSNCFALLVGCHCTLKKGLEFEHDNPGGKAVYVSPDKFFELAMEAQETPKMCSLKILMLAACHSEAVAKSFNGSKVVDHVIACNEDYELGDQVVRTFQKVFFEKLFCGATVSTSFEAAKKKLQDMANELKKEAESLKCEYDSDPSRIQSLTNKANMLNEEVKKYLLLPTDGNHDVSFSFRPYSSPLTAKLKTWIPPQLNKFYQSPFSTKINKQLKWAIDHYLLRNLYTAMQSDHENSMRSRWVQITGPKGIGKTSVAKFIASLLRRYDNEGPDGIFWVEGKIYDEVIQSFIKRLPQNESSPTEKIEKYDPLEKFFTEKDDPPTLLIIDDVDEIKEADHEKLFKYLMNLNRGLHILTTSNAPIRVKGFDSNVKDLELKFLTKEIFKRVFHERARDLGDSKFQTLVNEIKRKPSLFSELYGSKVFTEIHRNPRTAILLAQKIKEMKVKKIEKFLLVDTFNKLVEEKAL